MKIQLEFPHARAVVIIPALVFALLGNVWALFAVVLVLAVA